MLPEYWYAPGTSEEYKEQQWSGIDWPGSPNNEILEETNHWSNYSNEVTEGVQEEEEQANIQEENRSTIRPCQNAKEEIPPPIFTADNGVFIFNDAAFAAPTLSSLCAEYKHLGGFVILPMRNIAKIRCGYADHNRKPFKLICVIPNNSQEALDTMKVSQALN